MLDNRGDCSPGLHLGRKFHNTPQIPRRRDLCGLFNVIIRLFQLPKKDEKKTKYKEGCMKMYHKFITLFLSFAVLTIAQTMPDFSVKDLDGNTINLYADYLDKGKYAVLCFSMPQTG